MDSIAFQPAAAAPPVALEPITNKTKKPACINAAKALGIPSDGKVDDVHKRVIQYIKANSATIAMNSALQTLLHQSYHAVEQSGSRSAPVMQSSDKEKLDNADAAKEPSTPSGALKTIAELKLTTDPPAIHGRLGAGPVNPVSPIGSLTSSSEDDDDTALPVPPGKPVSEHKPAVDSAEKNGFIAVKLFDHDNQGASPLEVYLPAGKLITVGTSSGK
ncbi:hypothetical protein C8J56DRAFT_1166584 [Mycena floridula]|nr:hypothetical protein C8J56DRAFT_1166584 [Mycena floridula]